MFAGYAGRGYYGGGAGGGSDDEDRKPDRHDLFSSFPQKGKKKTQADYDAELKIKKKRLQEANVAKLNRKIVEWKEDMVFKAIKQDDSSDEDAIVMVPSDITAVTLTTGGSNRMRSRSRSPKRRRSGRSRERRRGKRRGSPSSSPTSSSSSSSRDRSRSRDRDRRRRKRSHSRSRSRDRKRDRKRSRSRSRKRSRKDKKRRRSSSSSPEVVKDLSKLSRNQRNFAKPKGPVKLAMKDIGNVMKNIDRMSVAELYVNDYHPVHILKDFDFLPESDRVDFNASLYVTPYIVDPNDHKQLIKAPRSEAIKENIHKKHVTLRFHNAKPNVKKTESIFRELDFPDDIDEIKISHMDGDFKFRHEIEAEEAAERQKKDMMDEIRRELPCEEDTLLMEARLKIRANPRDPKTYLDFIEVEDKINERNRQFGQPSNELAQKERKVAILNQGIKKCAKSVELRIAKAEVENTEVAWGNLAFDFKNSSLVWTKYIDFVMYSSKIGVDKVDNVFKKCLAEMGSVLRGECRSHKLELGTELFLYELFIRRLKFWREIGQWEQLIASIQASIEYTFFAPQNLLTSEMSHRKKMDLFRQYWESGCPRIGDRGWVSWESFNPEEWTPERSMNVEFIDVEREEGRVTRIRQKVGLRVGPPKLKRWAYLDRNVVNARCRPMRNEHYVDEHNMDAYRYVSFSDLHICELLNSQLLEVLSFAGMKIVGQDNVYPDTISLARDYGVSTEDSFLPATALKIILRICRQLAAFSPDNIQLMYSMIPSFIPILNCTKPNTKNRGTKVMARFKAYIANLKGKPCKGPKRKQKEAVESSDDEDGMDDEQPLPQYMDVDEQEHRDFKGVLTDFFAFHAYSCCTKAAKNDSSLYINFTDSVVMFRDTTLTAQMTMNAIIIAILNILDCAKKDRQKNSELILRKLQHWMCKLAGYSDKEEEITAIKAQKAMNEVMLRTKFANDNNVTNSLSLIFPSYYSLAYCIDMWLIALRADTYSLTHIEKLTKKWTDFYKDTSGEPMGCRAVHETLLNILHRDWMWFHRGKNELYFHLKYHLDTFPFSDQPIRIATDLLAANASIVSFCHKMDQIFGNYTGGDVAETRRALAHIAVVLKKRAQIQKSIDEKTGVHDVHTINEINRYLSKVCMREADRLRDPYLWRLAMRHAHTPADFEEAYIRATKTCRFSRELHLDAIQLGDEITEQNAVKMMTEFSVRMAMTLDDVTFCEDLVVKHIAEGILKK